VLLVDTFGRAWCIRQIPGIGIVFNNKACADRALDWIGFVDPSLILFGDQHIHGLIIHLTIISRLTWRLNAVCAVGSVPFDIRI
jgi:hypothetical protein